MFIPPHWKAALLTVCLPLTLLSAEPPPLGDPFLVKGAAPAAPRPPAQQSLYAVYEVFALKTEDAWELLDAQQDSADRYKRLEQWLSEGKARLETLMGAATTQGSPLKVESLDEVVTWNARESRKEVRQIGDALKMEFVPLEDGQSAQIDALPERVELDGFHPEDEEAEKLQPRFVSEKIQTSVTGQLNRPCYLGTMSRARYEAAGAENEMKLAFLTLHSVPFGVAQAGQPTKKVAPTGMKKDRSETSPTLDLDCLVYSMERNDAHRLIQAESSRALWDNLQGLLESKKARKETRISLANRHGNSAKAEFVREIGAPSSYYDMEREEAGESKTDAGSSSKASSSNASPSAMTLRPRKPGFTLSVEHSVDERGYLKVSISIEQVLYHGLFPLRGRERSDRLYPLFESRTISTTQEMPPGLACFVGTLNPAPANILLPERPEPDRTWLVFLRSTPRKP
jgi:hypothetical protein